MKQSRSLLIPALLIIVCASPAAQESRRSGEGFFAVVAGQPLSFKGDFDGRLVLWHFDKAFFVPELKPATAFELGLGVKRNSWLWEIHLLNSRHRAVLQGREESSFYRAIEIEGRTFFVRNFPLKPYLLGGISIPWLSVDRGAELTGTKYRASYIGLGLNLGLGMILDVTPFLFISGGGGYRALGYYYVSGEGKGRDINTLSVGQSGTSFKRWLKTSSLGWSFGLGVVF